MLRISKLHAHTHHTCGHRKRNLDIRLAIGLGNRATQCKIRRFLRLRSHTDSYNDEDRKKRAKKIS